MTATLTVTAYAQPDPDLAHPCDPEPIGNLCEACDCHGSIVIYLSALRDWETGEYLDIDEVPCPTCHGAGYLTTPADPDPDMQEAHEKARLWTISRHTP